VKVLLVDDEPLARRRLVRLLRDVPGAEVVGEAADGEEALRQIHALAPDVVFLDIRMPRLDGLAVAAAAGDVPAIVFVTAHAEHAIAAFEAAAVDYLLKPVEPERLARTLERVRVRGKSQAEILPRLLSPPRVVAVESGETHLFDAREIPRFWSLDKYTSFRHGGREHLTVESLTQLEARLAEHGFFRVHRGELIALDRVRTLADGEDGLHAVLDDGDRARVSRRLAAELRRRLGLR
jgi:DNA-binding LytR/AlgR family response regulator